MLQQALPVTGVKHLIAVASGKGGVGKSTVAVNLALALVEKGRRAGILDADIYGPSIPTLLGVHDRPQHTEDKKIHPVTVHGLQAMSIGWLVDASAPMIWRGPMATSALQQLLRDTLWDAVDELVIDLPPGTGDIHLTLAQKIPVTAAIIVTTPHALALVDARRALEMFRRVKIPILGVIENMSGYQCSKCDHHESIFGEGGGAVMAKEYDVPFLGALPLAAMAGADQGLPIVLQAPHSSMAAQYRHIAEQLMMHLKRPKETAFPEIMIRND